MGPRWRYLANELGLGLRRNVLMTVATVLTVAVSLSLLGVGLLVRKQVNIASDLFFSQVEVSIFLQEGISEGQRSRLETELRTHPVVEDVIYESKQDAYEHFQEIFRDNPNLLEGVTPEILPASFRVKLVDPEEFAVVESAFAGYPGVDVVSDQRDMLDRLFSILNYLRDGAIGIAAIQIVGAAALIFNTIRMTAFARREQTGIMKLVGATNWYIRLPFVLEGVVAAVLGALFSAGVLLFAAGPLLGRVREEIVFFPIIGSREVFEVLPVLFVVAVVVAAVSSFLSLRRFLAV
jgi:cell division transport system permease protein